MKCLIKFRSAKFVILILSLCLFNLKVKANSEFTFQLDSLKSVVLSDSISKEQLANSFHRIAQIQVQTGNAQNAIESYQKSLELYSEISDYQNKTKVIVDLGVVHHVNNEFDKALKYFYLALDALSYAKKTLSDKEYKLYRGIIFLDISVIFGEIKYYDAALNYAIKANKTIPDSDSLNKSATISNLGTVYLGLQQSKEARKYFDKSINYYNKGFVTNNGLAVTHTNMGTSYLIEKNYEQALFFYNKALEFYNQEQENYEGEKSGVLAKIAKTHAERGEINKAKQSVELALQLVDKGDETQFMESIYESLVELYTAMNHSEKAFESLKKLNAVKDSLYNHEVLGNIINIQKEYDQKKLIEENKMKLRLMQQEQTIRLYKWYVFSGLLLIIALILLLLFYKQKYKANVSKIEIKNIKLEQEQLASKLAFKNNELTNFAMYIVKKNDFLETIKNEVNALKSEKDRGAKINKLSSTIKRHINSSRDRKDFELRIENEYQDFYYKLNKRFPDLTEKDRKLCSLLLLDLSSKDIASIMNIASTSVDKSRYRLRKKLGMESDATFSAYLRNL